MLTDYTLSCCRQHNHMTWDLMISFILSLLNQVIIHNPESELNLRNVTDFHSVKLVWFPLKHNHKKQLVFIKSDWHGYFKENEIYIKWIFNFKGIIHDQMKIMSSFINPEVVPNLNECLSLVHTKEEWRMLVTMVGSHWFPWNFFLLWKPIACFHMTSHHCVAMARNANGGQEVICCI